MNFDVIDIGSLGEYINPSGYISIDLGLDQNNDLIFNADGTFGNISGTLKLVQDIKLFLLSPPRTSILDPTWGNPAIEEIGKAPVNNASLINIVKGAVASLKAFKDNEQKLRGFPLEGAELISSVGTPVIVNENPNAFGVRIFVVDGQNNEQNIDLTLSDD